MRRGEQAKAGSKLSWEEETLCDIVGGADYVREQYHMSENEFQVVLKQVSLKARLLDLQEDDCFAISGGHHKGENRDRLLCKEWNSVI